MGRRLTKGRAVARLAVSQVRHERGRTVLVVLAIALAVLAVTLLASLGLGVLQTGEERFDRAGQDVWISGEAVELTATGGLENPITDSHRIAGDLEQRDDVESASPLAFHAIYVGTEPDDLELVTGSASRERRTPVPTPATASRRATPTMPTGAMTGR